MLRVTFRETRYNGDLATVFLPAIPSVGEPVHLQQQSRGKAIAYRVTSRHWHIMAKAPEDSEVVILVTED